MTTGALLFLVLSWLSVLGLTIWSYGRILKIQREKSRGK